MSKIEKNKNAIGWIPLAHYNQYVLDKKKYNLKAISYNGVAPTIKNIKSKKYYLVRPLILITGKKPTREESEFINYFPSEKI
jgi:ABC-type phosphate transport system substrate-binding protein